MRLLKIKDVVPVYFTNDLPIGIFAFGGGHVSSPPPAPVQTDPAVEEAQRKEKLLAQFRNGRRQTILTSPTGLAPEQKSESLLTKALK